MKTTLFKGILALLFVGAMHGASAQLIYNNTSCDVFLELFCANSNNPCTQVCASPICVPPGASSFPSMTACGMGCTYWMSVDIHPTDSGPFNSDAGPGNCAVCGPLITVWSNSSCGTTTASASTGSCMFCTTISADWSGADLHINP